MKHAALFTLLFTALSALAFTASAQTATPATTAAESIDGTAIGPDTVDSPASKEVVGDRNCLRETGSRIAPKADRKGRRCISASGRSYDREDVERTGATDLADALRRLDPSIR